MTTEEWTYDPGLDNYCSSEEIRPALGMVVPVWFPEDFPRVRMRRILSVTLRDCGFYVEPLNIKVVVDGAPWCSDVLDEVREETDIEFDDVHLETNRGKGAAVCAGMRRALARSDVAFVAVRDADGDHFLNDVPHLFRIGKQVVRETGNSSVLVIGRRSSVHRPLGFLRGEYERLLNRVIVDALMFDLARQGEVLNTQYWVEDPPDLQSGYKLYSRASVEQIVDVLSDRGEDGEKAARYGSEIVPFVEIVLAGGIAGEISRVTYNEQPTSMYSGERRPVFYGQRTLWVFRRLNIETHQAKQLLDNGVSKSLLRTDPRGMEELRKLRAYVLEGLGAIAPAEEMPLGPAYC